MSKNFELLTQVDKNRQLFEEPDRTAQPVIASVSETKSGTAEKPVEGSLEALAQVEVAKLVQRLFRSSRDCLAPRAVMFCGIENGVGTSWVSAQVARTVAARGTATVCLIDANLRSPSLHTHFDLSEANGLADAVREAGPIHRFLQSGHVSNLHVLSAGANADRCLMVGSERFRERVAELRAEFDYLIFDVSPVGHSGDAIALGQMVDGVVIVVAANSTRRAVARKAKENLEAAQVRLLGTVLNNRTFPIPEPLYRRL